MDERREARPHRRTPFTAGTKRDRRDPRPRLRTRHAEGHDASDVLVKRADRIEEPPLPVLADPLHLAVREPRAGRVGPTTNIGRRRRRWRRRRCSRWRRRSSRSSCRRRRGCGGRCHGRGSWRLGIRSSPQVTVPDRVLTSRGCTLACRLVVVDVDRRLERHLFDVAARNAQQASPWPSSTLIIVDTDHHQLGRRIRQKKTLSSRAVLADVLERLEPGIPRLPISDENVARSPHEHRHAGDDGRAVGPTTDHGDGDQPNQQPNETDDQEPAECGRGL